ncbi:hypothetical protein PBR20603_03003 [Pandoraea bronchicola]|uniref:Uncharacterized protein n=1 Tax=Pandoraea bronchicola TaxID=2508287 RepID=A0A5E5BUE4_9BURK|nr:hypothetical protein PBR20603_03003 [Pandoraea bronchicola]
MSDAHLRWKLHPVCSLIVTYSLQKSLPHVRFAEKSRPQSLHGPLVHTQVQPKKLARILLPFCFGEDARYEVSDVAAHVRALANVRP